MLAKISVEVSVPNWLSRAARNHVCTRDYIRDVSQIVPGVSIQFADASTSIGDKFIVTAGINVDGDAPYADVQEYLEKVSWALRKAVEDWVSSKINFARDIILALGCPEVREVVRMVASSES